MPGSQLMITGGSGFGSVGGISPGLGPGMTPPGMLPPGLVPPPMVGIPPMGGMMGGYGQPPSPYGSRGPYG